MSGLTEARRLLHNIRDVLRVDIGCACDLDVAHLLARAREQTARVFQACTTPPLQIDVLLVRDQGHTFFFP